MILIENLSFRWRSDEAPTLEIPSFAIERGEKVLLRGPSGSGKTTLLNILGGVLTPDAGKVTVDDVETSALSAAARDRFRADRIGYIFQMFNLLPYLSMGENVALPCRFSASRRARAGNVTAEANRLLSRMGLGGAAAGRAVSDLSVGQQQRVAAARAMIGAPALVIADEPTSAMDVQARDAFLSLLTEEADRASATLLFVSHDPSIGVWFDRSVELSDINRATAADAER